MRDQSAPEPNKTNRRSLLLGASVASAAAVATVAATRSFEPQALAQSEAKPAPANGGGYHVTDHIKQYYATTLV